MVCTNRLVSAWSRAVLLALLLTVVGGAGCSRHAAFQSFEWTGTESKVELRLEGQLPFLPVTAGQEKLELLLDLGGTHAISLTPDQLLQMQGVQFTGKTRRWTNVKGHVMVARIFVLPDVQIGPLRFLDVRGVEAVQDPDYPTPHHTGTIGRGILDAVPVLIDYPGASISFLSQSKPHQMEQIAEACNGRPRQWVEVKLSASSYGNVIPADVGGKQLDLILDTGATHSFLHPKVFAEGGPSTVEVTTTSGSLGIIHFKSFAFDMPPVDGFLGFDFFLDRPVIVDKPAGYVYVAMYDSIPPAPPR